MLAPRGVDIERSQEAFDRLSLYVAELAEKLRPRKVILLGSLLAASFLFQVRIY